MKIAGVGTAFPVHYYEQETILAALAEHLGTTLSHPARLFSFHRNVGVRGRHLALAIPEYAALDTFGKANDAWLRVAMDVGARAVEGALAEAGIDAGRVDSIISTTVTGIATPSLDARLMNRLPFRRDVKRVPLFGLGCVAGAAGIARAADYLRGHDDHVVVVLSVELCSLTLRRSRVSVADMIASGLFGDGAAAVVVAGAATGLDGPAVIGSRSVFYPDSERVMGWDVTEDGLGLVLSASVPDVVRRNVGGDVDRFLAEHGLARGDIASWICHPGGPKVLEAMQEALALQPSALELTWKSLAEVGNLSSTSILLVLRDTLREARPAPGEYALMIAMGPGFCAELVLLRF